MFFGLADQLLRSSTSIGANKTKFWLGLLRDGGKADRNNANPLLQEADEFSKILGASILTAKGKRKF